VTLCLEVTRVGATLRVTSSSVSGGDSKRHRCRGVRSPADALRDRLKQIEIAPGRIKRLLMN
jgi:hypothetical protein